MVDEDNKHEVFGSSHSENVDAYERARRRVKEVKGFYNHLITFIVINIFLAVINIITSPGSWWFYWITIFWGFGLVWHGASLYMNRGVFSKDWEDKKIKEYMEKEE
jgi:hypothetical protein